jgi:hypothetical protein
MIGDTDLKALVGFEFKVFFLRCVLYKCHRRDKLSTHFSLLFLSISLPSEEADVSNTTTIPSLE